ncbi:DHHA1 domain protein [archaeon BMS3Abin16]|nr:DHHA1 domain protein [archaeon BMS3Abin16]
MKTAIVVHGDSDGICSAAITLNRYPGSSIWFTHPVGLLGDLKNVRAERIVICDLAISEREKDDLFEEFLNRSSTSEIIYIDHHPLPLNTIAGDIPASHVVRDLTKSASELTFTYLGRPEMKLIALFGAISDYYTDSTAFVKTTLDVLDKRTIYLEAGLLSQALGMQGRRDYDFKRKLVEALSKGVMPSSRPDIVRKAVAGTKREWEAIEYVRGSVETIDGIGLVRNVPRGFSPNKSAKLALGVTGLPLCIGTRRKKGHIDFSARKRSTFSLDLNVTFRTIAPRFGGSGGGHPTAAGARIPQKHFDEILEALQKEVEAIPY